MIPPCAIAHLVVFPPPPPPSPEFGDCFLFISFSFSFRFLFVFLRFPRLHRMVLQLALTPEYLFSPVAGKAGCYGHCHVRIVGVLLGFISFFLSYPLFFPSTLVIGTHRLALSILNVHGLSRID